MSIRIRNDNYWKKRSMQRLVDAEKNSLPYLRQIKKLYRNSAKETVETVRSLYKTYYKGKDGFDIKALEKIANTGDLKRFKAELKREGLSTYLPEHYRGRLDRAELLNAKLWAECKKIAFQEQQISTESYNKTFKDTYDRTIYDISKGINKNIAFSEIPQKTIDEILNAKFYGENYSQRVWHNTGKLANKLQEIIGQSILTGQSQSKTIRQIMEAYGTRGKAKGGYYDAERLIRTETNYFENKAEIESYDEIGVKKFKYLAVLDNRTSEICQEMDGKIFDVKDAVQGENTPPLHPNCRSTIVPYISEEYKPKTRIARDPETGKNYYIENMNYKEWEKEYISNKQSEIDEYGSKENSNENKDLALDSIKQKDIKYNKVNKLNKKLNTNQIIDKISGGDETNGSCSSLSLVYAGNKAGYDVLDFRGGESQKYFAKQGNMKRVLDDLGVKYKLEKNYNDYDAVKSLMKEVQKDKEYILMTGKHSAIIRKNSNNGWQFLELQSAKVNGFKPLNIDILQNRFKCQRSHIINGLKYKSNNILVDIDEFKQNEKFPTILGYINTNKQSQLKGSKGYEK